MLSSSNPTGGPSAWKLVHLVPAEPGTAGVSCSSVLMCVVVESGMILTSIVPSGGRSAWTAPGVQAGLGTSTIACPSPAFCVANGSDFGEVVASTSPTGTAEAWRQTRVDGTNTLNVVSCPSISLCVVGDADGNVMVGTPTGYPAAVPTVIVRHQGLLGAGSLVARRHGSRTTADTGLAVACPAAGPACGVNGIAVVDDVSTGRTVPISRVHLVIPSGKRRRIVFVLSASVTRIFGRNHGSLEGDMQVVARAGHGLAVANDLLYFLRRGFR